MEDLLVGFLPNLRRFAISLSGSRDVADDLVQAACERALANSAQYRQGTRFDAWMFRILRNLWIDQFRKGRAAGPQDPLDDHPDLAVPSGEQLVGDRIMLDRVLGAMGKLSAEQREVLVLVCVEELSYRDSAEILGVPIGTVMSRLARARRNLAEIAGISGDVWRSASRKGSET